ncbi:hypothetical protein N7470_005793 [Penicillium chermesinum]|nr:hypothetical protein N7470_005793 [Penicillium chermesinum]
MEYEIWRAVDVFPNHGARVRKQILRICGSQNKTTMDNGRSPTDIITYIGVPLAVLGVLPIIYTSVRAILTQRSIRSILKRHDLLDSALTRVSLIGGLVEVELPRCTITPLDRELDDGYWKLNTSHVPLKGGSWSIFHWNRLITGKVLYRCQYKDELKIPQADIGFEELIAFLLDRGAVPDNLGWRMLKTAGLWTPPGTALLRPPSGAPGAVLTVAPAEDSDGVLSLQVQWRPEWQERSQASLPPLLDEDEEKPEAGSGTESTEVPARKPSLLTTIQGMKTLLKVHGSDSIRFRAEGDRVTTVFFEESGIMTGERRDLSTHGETFRHWFVCVASALGEYEGAGLYNISIPANTLAFRNEEDRLARQMEDIMPPHQAAEARRIRSQREASRFHYGHLKRNTAMREYEERRLVEAIQSPRLDNKVIAEASLAYLTKEGIVPEDYSVETLARAILYLIMLDESQAKKHSRYSGAMDAMVPVWWNAKIAVVQQANATESTLGSDMLESMRLWRRVRLG